MAEYIERGAFIELVKDIPMWGSVAALFADRIPAADVAPVVHGRWIVRFGGPYNRRRCYCSHCGKHNGVVGIAKNQEKPYCPNCGAKMDGGDSDEADRR